MFLRKNTFVYDRKSLVFTKKYPNFDMKRYSEVIYGIVPSKRREMKNDYENPTNKSA